MKKDYSSNILNSIVVIGIILTLIALLAMPLILTAMLKSGLGIVGSSLPMNISIVIYICAAPYVIALFILKKLCKIVAIKQPFSRDIPKYLKKISICAFSEILIYNIVQVLDIYLYGLTIILAIVVSFVSLAIGFLSLVLSKLFDMAIEIKEENDKTI